MKVESGVLEYRAVAKGHDEDTETNDQKKSCPGGHLISIESLQI